MVAVLAVLLTDIGGQGRADPPIEVAAGKTLTQDVGGKGRAVIGRVANVPTNAPDQRLIHTAAKLERMLEILRDAQFVTFTE